MLPAIAALIPAFTLESAAVATAVSGFFTYLWQQNIKSGDSIDFTFDEEMQKLPAEYTKMDNSLAVQTASSVTTFQTAIDNYRESLPVKQTISPANTTQQIQVKTGLTDVIKSSNIEMIEQQKILNNNLATQNEILVKTLEAKGVELINQNKLITILSENLKSLNLSVATLATTPKILATNSDYSITMQGLIYEELTKLTEATKTTGSVSVNPSVHVDITPLVEANKTIASGVENQVATNAKIVANLDRQNDHYDYLKDGVSTLKDSDGTAIIPRDVQAKINAEKLIEQESINKTTIEELMALVPALAGEALNDGESGLDSTDGFSLGFNPFAYVDNILMKDFEDYKKKYYPNTQS